MVLARQRVRPISSHESRIYPLLERDWPTITVQLTPQGAAMGDKSPKSKDKNKKQNQAVKDKKSAAHDASVASKRKDTK